MARQASLALADEELVGDSKMSEECELSLGENERQRYVDGRPA